ncbi:hypothetical protein J6590_097843 [Homalodisca vitripennis]|nr:hypothetical protein J6590_097843 [Homalodisca vitripennis]
MMTGRSPIKPYSFRPHGPLACARILTNRIRGEPIQYEIDGTDKNCNGHIQDLNCAISNSDPRSNDLDRSPIATPNIYSLVRF